MIFVISHFISLKKIKSNHNDYDSEKKAYEKKLIYIIILF